MKVQAKEREFSIFDLFCHDHESVNVRPFSQWALAAALTTMAEELYPEYFIQFVCPDDSGLGQWNVRFNKNRYDYDNDNNPKYTLYPMPRVYDERAFRRLLPAELDEVLLELNKVVVEL
jgi:hypothetical protein